MHVYRFGFTLAVLFFFEVVREVVALAPGR